MKNPKNNKPNSFDTVMLVDDDEMSIYLEKKIIEQTGLVNTIKTFDNGLEAINFLKDNLNNPEVLPKIILLDICMPIMDGWAFLEEFKDLKHHLEEKIVIYILSSSISSDDIKKVQKINEVSNFIIKPITKEVFEKIAKALKNNKFIKV